MGADEAVRLVKDEIIWAFVHNPISPTQTGQILFFGTVAAVIGVVLMVRSASPPPSSSTGSAPSGRPRSPSPSASGPASSCWRSRWSSPSAPGTRVGPTGGWWPCRPCSWSGSRSWSSPSGRCSRDPRRPAGTSARRAAGPVAGAGGPPDGAGRPGGRRGATHARPRAAVRLVAWCGSASWPSGSATGASWTAGPGPPCSRRCWPWPPWSASSWCGPTDGRCRRALQWLGLGVGLVDGGRGPGDGHPRAALLHDGLGRLQPGGHPTAAATGTTPTRRRWPAPPTCSTRPPPSGPTRSTGPTPSASPTRRARSSSRPRSWPSGSPTWSATGWTWPPGWSPRVLVFCMLPAAAAVAGAAAAAHRRARRPVRERGDRRALRAVPGASPCGVGTGGRAGRRRGCRPGSGPVSLGHRLLGQADPVVLRAVPGGRRGLRGPAGRRGGRWAGSACAVRYGATRPRHLPGGQPPLPALVALGLAEGHLPAHWPSRWSPTARGSSPSPSTA